MKFSNLSKLVIGCAINVHKYLGPGLLESVYQKCLLHELRLKGLSYKTEYPINISYKGFDIKNIYRVDLLIDNQIVCELKSVKKLLPIHTAQLNSYMKLLNKKQGLLFNFNVIRLKDGIKSICLN